MDLVLREEECAEHLRDSLAKKNLDELLVRLESAHKLHLASQPTYATLVGECEVLRDWLQTVVRFQRALRQAMVAESLTSLRAVFADIESHSLSSEDVPSLEEARLLVATLEEEEKAFADLSSALSSQADVKTLSRLLHKAHTYRFDESRRQLIAQAEEAIVSVWRARLDEVEKKENVHSSEVSTFISTIPSDMLLAPIQSDATTLFEKLSAAEEHAVVQAELEEKAAAEEAAEKEKEKQSLREAMAAGDAELDEALVGMEDAIQKRDLPQLEERIDMVRRASQRLLNPIIPEAPPVVFGSNGKAIVPTQTRLSTAHEGDESKESDEEADTKDTSMEQEAVGADVAKESTAPCSDDGVPTSTLPESETTGTSPPGPSAMEASPIPVAPMLKDVGRRNTMRRAVAVRDMIVESQNILDKLRLAIEQFDREEMTKLLMQCLENSVEDNEDVILARELCYGISEEEFLNRKADAGVTALPPTQDHARRESVLSNGESRSNLLKRLSRSSLLSEAESIELPPMPLLPAPAPPMPSSPVASSKVPACVPPLPPNTERDPKWEAMYTSFLKLKYSYPLAEFPLLRREGNYAKRFYLSKKDLKKKRLVHQQGDIPRSLFKLSTSYCGGSASLSKKLKKEVSQTIFKSKSRFI